MRGPGGRAEAGGPEAQGQGGPDAGAARAGEPLALLTPDPRPGVPAGPVRGTPGQVAPRASFPDLRAASHKPGKWQTPGQGLRDSHDPSRVTDEEVGFRGGDRGRAAALVPGQRDATYYSRLLSDNNRSLWCFLLCLRSLLKGRLLKARGWPEGGCHLHLPASHSSSVDSCFLGG